MWKKILLGVFGLFLILFAALLIVAKVMITPERHVPDISKLMDEGKDVPMVLTK